MSWARLEERYRMSRLEADILAELSAAIALLVEYE
jgi:hypothetical protein